MACILTAVVIVVTSIRIYENVSNYFIILYG